MYRVHEQIGNFSAPVYKADSWYEVQDYLFDRLHAEHGYDVAEDDEELFFSYFAIEEV